MKVWLAAVQAVAYEGTSGAAAGGFGDGPRFGT
jgi:hypothetical protein